MNRVKSAALPTMTLIAVLAAVAACLLPASAPNAEARPLYQAGIERADSHICRCPVRTGDCVCELTL